MDKTTAKEQIMTTAAPLARVCATSADDLAFANALEKMYNAYMTSGISSAEEARITKEALALCHEYLAKKPTDSVWAILDRAERLARNKN
jgi:hypothetical protein